LNEKLWQAAEKGDAETCRKLLNKELSNSILPSLNTKGLDDWTALHLAANEGNLSVCEVLIFEGEMTDLEARTSLSRTPLHLASMRGHQAVVKLLISEGADIDAVDTYLNTPIHYSSQFGHVECTKRLLKHGASFRMRNNLGQTAWDCAGSMEVYELFFSYYSTSGTVLLKSSYSRTPFNNVLMRNSREDQINKLLYKAFSQPSTAQMIKL
jgi:ankyrin repeat protein